MRRFGTSAHLLVCVLLAGLAGSARAKRVVVTGFAGPGGARARSYVLRVVRRNHDLVPVRRFSRTARRLRVRLNRKRGVRRICERLGVDAVVYGRVVRRRGRWWLRLYVREGRTGRIVKREVIRLRGPRLDGSSRYDVRHFLRKALARARGPVTEEVEEAPQPRPVETEVHKEAPAKKPKKERGIVRSRRYSHLTAVEGGIVLEAVGRKFTIAPEDANPDYKTQGVIRPPFGFWVEVFPMAFLTTKMGLADFGFGIWWTRSFGQVSDAGPAGSGFPTTYQKTEIYATYRFNFLRKPSSVELRLDLGLAEQQFSISAPEGSGDQVMSVGVDYWCFMPRLRLRVPVVAERLTLLARFAYMHPFQFGDTAEPWAYGRAKGWGLELQAGLDVRLINFVYFRLMARYSYFGLTYLRSGEQGVDYAFEGDSASDHYYGAMFSLMVQYSHFVPPRFL